ncbi:MAG: ATP-dependent DNA ligase [Patescibacteria group bacterium]
MRFKEFAEQLEKLEKISSRLEITDEVVRLLAKLSTEEVAGAIYILMGRLEPTYTGLEFNLGWKMLLRSIGELSGEKNEKVLADFKKKGDVGEVMMDLPEKVFSDKKLSVKEVYERLILIAKYAGGGSQEKKVSELAKLFADLPQLSAKFVARIVLGRLRLGFSDKTILDALSVAERGDKSARKKLDEAYQIRPDAGHLGRMVLSKGLDKALVRLEVEVGVPVMPALCQRLNHAAEIIEKMGAVAAEQKFDGTRVQIHFKRKGFSDGSKVKTYTRNLEENSQMFPELSSLADWIAGDEVVLDAEAVGIDIKTGKILPFQMTITRKRKHGIPEAASAIPLRFFVFDILARDGKTFLAEPYFERRKILSETIKENKTVVVDETHRTTDAGELHKWHEEFLAEGFEGAVIKKWDGFYLPGRQGWNWVKIKEKEGSTGKLSDTLDLVVMGYYRGRGKRTDFGLGAFLAGVRKGEKVVTIAKIGTGLSDEQFRDLKKRLDGLVVAEMPKEYEVDKALIADVWTTPKVVVEIAADEITKSPVHSAGVALRFPRLIKFRDDKDLAGVTTLSEVEEIS